jgi:hypothetical protein
MSFNPTASTATNPIVTYNGYQFPPNTTESGLRRESIYSEDGRTITGTRLVVDVKSRIVAATLESAEAAATQINSLLSEPRKPLVLSAQGWGTMSVGSAGTANNYDDMEYGPKPQVRKFERIGANLAFDVSWSCVCVISECVPNSGNGVVRERNFTVSYSRDSDGFVTRTIAGKLKVANVAGQDGIIRTLPDDPTFLSGRIQEYYFSALGFLTPVGFKRETETVGLNSDKTEIAFTYVDVQLRNGVLPANVVRFRGTHTLASATRSIRGQFDSTIQANYLIDPAYTGNRVDLAWSRFLNLCAQRYVRFMLITRLVVTEDIADGSVSFTMSWKALSPFGDALQNFNNLSATTGFGLQLRLDGNDKANQTNNMSQAKWGAWARSVPNIQSGIMGGANPALGAFRNGEIMKGFRVGSEAIINPCTDRANITVAAGDAGSTGNIETGSDTTDADQPAPEWLYCHAPIMFYTDYGVAVRRLSQLPAVTLSPNQSLTNATGFAQENPEGAVGPIEPTGENNITPQMGAIVDQNVSIQKARGAVTWVVLSVAAERIGKAIPTPRLVSTTGKQLVLVDSKVTPFTRSTPGNVTVYGIRGVVIYAVRGNPSDYTVAGLPSATQEDVANASAGQAAASVASAGANVAGFFSGF